jgi:hypothetical protein
VLARTLEDLFGPPISVYTREDALADGVLVSAMTPELGPVTGQHFKFPVAMTAGLAAVIDRAVAHPLHHNDRLGVWHDICWMLNQKIAGLPSPSSSNELFFDVIITGAARRGRYWRLKSVIGPDDHGEPCLTIMLPDED